jgi:hypothetical protein
MQLVEKYSHVCHNAYISVEAHGIYCPFLLDRRARYIYLQFMSGLRENSYGYENLKNENVWKYCSMNSRYF